MKNFQVIVLGIFIAAAVGGVIIFATRGNSSKDPSQEVPITVWGMVPDSTFADLLQALSQTDSKGPNITYVHKDAATFDTDLVEALASGTGPDVVLLPQDLIVRHKDKLYPIPYQSIAERQFLDTFIDEGQLYLSPDGILGLPFSIDPMVMYWNKDIFASAGIAAPPTSWEAFYQLAQNLSVKDQAFNISKSAVALGEFANIDHAKDIIALLMMQAGTSITTQSDAGKLQAAFGQEEDTDSGAAVAAVRFYTEFSDPVKPSYSWNRSLPGSKDDFLAGDLAVYIGYASELAELRQKNPNLNFDVAPLPQADPKRPKITFGKMQAFAILKASPNTTAAFTAITSLVGAGSVAQWSKLTLLPPVRRDLLAQKPTDPYQSVFYAAALIARGWLDPDPRTSDAAFKTMIESITSGKARIDDAVKRAAAELVSN